MPGMSSGLLPPKKRVSPVPLAKVETDLSQLLGFLTLNPIRNHSPCILILVLSAYFRLPLPGGLCNYRQQYPRFGELLSLKWFDFGRGKLSIKRSVSRRGFDADGPELLTPKTRNSVRECPMINAVKAFLDTSPRNALIVFRRGRRTGKTRSPRWATARHAAPPSNIRSPRAFPKSKSSGSATPHIPRTRVILS